MSWPQCVITQDDGAWRCTRPATHIVGMVCPEGQHVMENAMCYEHLMLVLAVAPTCGQHGRHTHVVSERLEEVQRAAEIGARRRDKT